MKIASINYSCCSPVMDNYDIREFYVSSRLKDENIESVIEKSDVLFFAPGSDINPVIYGHKNLDSSFIQARDILEIKCFNYAVKYHKAMVGICRGHQLLYALTGGTLIQDIEHDYNHAVLNLEDDLIYRVNSIHHQLVYPDNKHISLAIMTPHNPDKTFLYKDGTYTNLSEEIEAFRIIPDNKYPAILGVQWHPEMLSRKDSGRILFNQYFEDCIIPFIGD